jgi:hypothetical protein
MPSEQLPGSRVERQRDGSVLVLRVDGQIRALWHVLVRKTLIDVNSRTAEQPRIELPARKQHLVKS